MSSVAAEELELLSDAKYRLYVTSVDKALKSFEYTSEWADLISALGKLNKILLNHTKYPVIPRRMKISKRLAQCLHPALPSGVHLKALETYDIMFRTMGTNRLSQELFIYSSGLFPVLGHAATNVKPSLLGIYETHFIPLGEKLGPGLNGFLSGVLPGLEEGTDYYDRTNSLLEKVCVGVNSFLFYSCLWDCLISNAAVRLPAIIFILSHFDKHVSTQEQIHIMGNSIDAVVSGLCSCFQDESVLIQRSALDFSLIAFPMHNTCLSRNQCQYLITSVLLTLLRRDMSLNRRLFAWLLGSEVTSNAVNRPPSSSETEETNENHNIYDLSNDRYFEKYSKDLLISAIKCVLKEATGQSPHDLRPYRILISLLDKSDIGPLILDDILFEVFRLLYLCWQEPGDRASNGPELLKSANLLFSSLEPRYLWQYVGVQFSETCCKIPASVDTNNNENDSVKPVGSGDPLLQEVCSVIVFLLDSLSLEIYSETFSEYLPSLFLHIITSLTDHCDAINAYQMNASLKLCLKILSKIRSPLPILQNDLLNHTNVNSFVNFQNPDQRMIMSEPGKVIQLTKLNHSSSSSGEETTQEDNDDAETVINNEECDLNSSCGGITIPEDCENVDDSKRDVFISEDQPEKELSIMEKCLRDYKKFYVTFIDILRLKLGDTKSISNLFELLVIKSSETAAEDRIRLLESLLRKILCAYKVIPSSQSEGLSCNSGYEERDSNECPFVTFQEKDKIGDEWKDAVHHGSKLLIELSTFETSVPASVKFNDDNTNIQNGNELPDWLKSLIVCSCWLGNISVPLQLVTIATLLDLATLCRRTEIHKRRYSSPSKRDIFSTIGGGQSGDQSVTVVVFLPLLTADQLTFIEDRSNVFQVIMHWLWLHLDDSQHEIKAAELICQLQNTLENSDIIETCIEETLAASQPVNQRLHSFRKFVRFWNISREITKGADSLRFEDTFYRCMLKIVDNLLVHENNCLKLEAENWLFHSLLRGDCGRIMEPLLLILFDRRTARIGISYAKIQQHLQCDNAQVVDVQNNSIVYAVCSVYGSALTYHLVKNSYSHSNNVCSSKSSEDAGLTMIAGIRSLIENDNSSDSDACMSTAETVVVKENSLDSTSASFDEISVNSSKDISCQEYVKKLPYVQNISVFVNRGDSSPSIDESTDTLQSNISDTASAKDQYINGECANESSDTSDPTFLYNGNVIPVVKERLSKSKSESKINEKVHSYTSLEDTPITSASTSEFSQSNVNNLHTKSRRIAMSRAFHSSNAVDNESSCTTSTEADLPRSSSFSASETSADSMLNCKFKANKFPSCISNGSTSNIIAKAIVEDIITQIVDNVVEIKRPNNRSSVEKEEEGDSAISCNSGCSSVTLEYEKDNSIMDDDEHVCKKIAEELDRKSVEKSGSSLVGVQFYSHMLLYCDIYDKNRVLYTLQKFRDIIAVNAKSFLFVASTTAVPAQASLVNLLMKHRNSIFARGFQSNEKSSDTFHKNTTYLEVLITVCLYYIRSYYPNFGSPGLSSKDVFDNKQVQLASVDLLTEIFFQLGGILMRRENEMTSTVRELLNRCKVQKLALHCTWCCLCDHISGNVHDFVREILILNRMNEQPDEDSIEYSRAFQVQYLRLLLSLIILENEIYRKEENNINVVDNNNSKNDFLEDKPIIHQPLFFNLLKQMLESKDLRRPTHERVISFVVACLPFMKKALAKIMTNVIRQVCCNVEAAADIYKLSKEACVKQRVPFNYTVTLLDALTILSHYCLLEFNSQAVLKALSDAISLRTFKGLFQMYSDFPNSTNFGCNFAHAHNNEAKEAVLENLPKIFAAVSFLWQAISSLKSGDYDNVAGSLPQVKNQILSLLNPIANHHSIHFFISVAVVWKERASPVDNASQKSTMIPEANKDQLVLVQLLCSMTSITSDLLISSIHRIFKQRVVFNQERSGEIEMSVLEVLVHYIQLISVPKLIECWNSLVPLLREASSISPQSQFLLCAAVSQFVNRLPSTPDRLMDKKDFKDLQDVIIKLVDISTQIAGTGLEQTTWLRRNLAVRENASSNSGGVGSVLTSGILFNKDNDKIASGAQYSSIAQLVLAQLLIPMLDIIFSNQDKEKCVNLLINVMYNITPYLRNHTTKNAANFFACSQLLASISGYQYTRKAWKKDAMDLLLDSSLFQMEIKSLKYWRTIVDNLMSQDISTFRDLLSRVSINQNNTLNLFSSKDQEYELRSQLLKRLAFVILCCEQDQFHKHMPDIQEKLSDSLKLPQSTPGIQAQVFLCFRVLLLRMSPHHMTSLWPVIITEMVQVMLQMENELSTDIEESNSQSRSLGLEWSWSSGSSGSSISSGTSHPHGLQLQLAAAKLLKLAVQLPADRLPQFQMYRWAFVGKYRNPSTSSSVTSALCNSFGASVDFVPHVIRIASLMNSKYGNPPEKISYDNLLPAAYQVKTLQDLHSFFATLSFDYVFGEKTVAAGELENEIEMDFIE